MPAPPTPLVVSRPAPKAEAPSLQPLQPVSPVPAAKPTARRPAKSTRPARKAVPTGPMPWLDVAGAAALVLLSTAAVVIGLTGPLRFLLALPTLLFAPGYLLLQATVVPPARGRELGWQAFACLGISPALVGVLALATSIVEGGFRLGIIVGLVTLGSLALATVALVRRRSAYRPAGSPSAAPTLPAGAPPLAGGPHPGEAAKAKAGTLRP